MHWKLRYFSTFSTKCAEMRECMEMLFASMIETCFAGGGQPLSPPNHQSHPSVNRSFHQPTHPLIIQPIISRRIRESTSSGKRDTTAAEIRSSRACKLSRLSLSKRLSLLRLLPPGCCDVDTQAGMAKTADCRFALRSVLICCCAESLQVQQGTLL